MSCVRCPHLAQAPGISAAAAELTIPRSSRDPDKPQVRYELSLTAEHMEVFKRDPNAIPTDAP